MREKLGGECNTEEIDLLISSLEHFPLDQIKNKAYKHADPNCN
jgi:hypothetical protein